MLELITGSITVAGALALIVIIIISSNKKEMREKLATIEARNRERLALIEKGMDPLLADHIVQKPLKLESIVLWALLLIGVGIGILGGYLVSEFFNLNKIIIVSATATISGGIFLFIYFLFHKKKSS